MQMFTYWDCDKSSGRPTMFANGEACRQHARQVGWVGLVRAELTEEKDGLLLSAFDLAEQGSRVGFLGCRTFNPHEPLSDQVMKCVSDER